MSLKSCSSPIRPHPHLPSPLASLIREPSVSEEKRENQLGMTPI
ncbi:hypothetical protein E2C01_058014 [Portunus trituberculatus]|uniref:Uncharacterized protein n=1 Tax=Portunus trituberculatus TaxID=210409 RepID=A0A5B7H219_PORTR|nr:hypothetical protein [Portunus trituberculatus]